MRTWILDPKPQPAITIATRFVAGASKAGLAADAARQAAARVTSGDLAGLLAAAPAAARDALHSIALAAYGAGFASAAVVAACIAFIACVLAYGLISSRETAPVTPPPHQKMPCKMIEGTGKDPGKKHTDRLSTVRVPYSMSSKSQLLPVRSEYK